MRYDNVLDSPLMCPGTSINCGWYTWYFRGKNVAQACKYAYFINVQECMKCQCSLMPRTLSASHGILFGDIFP